MPHGTTQEEQNLQLKLGFDSTNKYQLWTAGQTYLRRLPPPPIDCVLRVDILRVLYAKSWLDPLPRLLRPASVSQLLSCLATESTEMKMEMG
jgi:hypothetical protein